MSKKRRLDECGPRGTGESIQLAFFYHEVLPKEIWNVILDFVMDDPKALNSRWKLVCKGWRQIFSSLVEKRTKGSGGHPQTSPHEELVKVISGEGQSPQPSLVMAKLGAFCAYALKSRRLTQVVIKIRIPTGYTTERTVITLPGGARYMHVTAQPDDVVFTNFDPLVTILCPLKAPLLVNPARGRYTGVTYDDNRDIWQARFEPTLDELMSVLADAFQTGIGISFEYQKTPCPALAALWECGFSEENTYRVNPSRRVPRDTRLYATRDQLLMRALEPGIQDIMWSI